MTIIHQPRINTKKTTEDTTEPGTLIIGSEANTNSTLDKVFRIHDTINEGYDFFNDDLGYTPEQVTIWYQDDEYLGPRGLAYYCASTICYNYTSPNTIVLTGNAPMVTYQHEERPYTILHEYGHFIMDMIYNDSFHNGCVGNHSFYNYSNVECAWTEGWANFVPLAVFNSSNYERTPMHIYNMEDRTDHNGNTFVPGNGTEGNVAALLWDIYDNANEQDVGGDAAKDDNLGNGISDIWNVTDDAPNTGETLPARTIFDFISDWDDQGLSSLDSIGYLNTIYDTFPVSSSNSSVITIINANQTIIFEDFEGDMPNWTLTYEDDEWWNIAVPYPQIPNYNSTNTAATPTTQHIYFTVIDSRVTDDKSYQGGIRFTPSTKKWQYESSTNTFKDFDPSIVTDLPHIDTAAGSGGDRWGWARLVIDIQENKYKRFEVSSQAKFDAVDMDGIDLVESASPTSTELLFYVRNTSTAAAAHTAYTTDWCVCAMYTV